METDQERIYEEGNRMITIWSSGGKPEDELD